MRGQYLTAVRFALEEQARNRFALVLLLAFVPLWDLLIGSAVPSSIVTFQLQSTGALIQADSRDLMMLAAGFNALTLIVAFMIFAATRRNGAFDRRLVLAGLSQHVAVAAKVTAIAVVSILVALYATTVLYIAWPSASFGPVWLAYTLDALIYGMLGFLLGALVRSELPGFFLIIMISLLDTFPQTPAEGPLSDNPALSVFPTYGPMQVAVSGGFGYGIPLVAVLASLVWIICLGTLALAIFWIRTRTPKRHRHAYTISSELIKIKR
jgi:ABC-2 type transport system permease protein